MQNEAQRVSDDFCCIKVTVLHTPPGEKKDFAKDILTQTSINYNNSSGLDMEEKLSNAFLESKCKSLLDSNIVVQRECRLLQTLSPPSIISNDNANSNKNLHSLNVSPQIQKALIIKPPENSNSGSCSCCAF